MAGWPDTRPGCDGGRAWGTHPGWTSCLGRVRGVSSAGRRAELEPGAGRDRCWRGPPTVSLLWVSGYQLGPASRAPAQEAEEEEDGIPAMTPSTCGRLALGRGLYQRGSNNKGTNNNNLNRSPLLCAHDG